PPPGCPRAGSVVCVTWPTSPPAPSALPGPGARAGARLRGVSTRPLSEAAPASGAPPSSVYGPGGRSPWLDIDWRRHQRWVDVDGQAVNTIELGEGEGQPIVFVHGLSGSWPNWLEQLPVLAREHRVLALDLPGFGHSPMPSGEISIPAYARLLDALLQRRGIDAATVV